MHLTKPPAQTTAITLRHGRADLISTGIGRFLTLPAAPRRIKGVGSPFNARPGCHVPFGQGRDLQAALSRSRLLCSRVRGSLVHDLDSSTCTCIWPVAAHLCCCPPYGEKKQRGLTRDAIAGLARPDSAPANRISSSLKSQTFPPSHRNDRKVIPEWDAVERLSICPTARWVSPSQSQGRQREGAFATKKH